jgi:hypothetical protein
MFTLAFDENANQSAMDSTTNAAQNKTSVSFAYLSFHHDSGGSGGAIRVPMITSSRLCSPSSAKVCSSSSAKVASVM